MSHTEGAVRVDISPEVAVVPGIGVENRSQRTVLVGDLRLDPSPRAPVPGDDDLVTDVDPSPVELLVVVGCAVVHIDQLAGHVSVRGVGVVCGQAPIHAGRGVRLQDGLGQERPVTFGGHHLHFPDAGLGEEHLVLDDLRVVSPVTKQVGDPLRILLIVGRADEERLSRDPLHPLSQIVAVHLLVEERLEPSLLVGGFGRKAQHGCFLGPNGQGGRQP